MTSIAMNPSAKKMQDMNMVWVDCEMTGLDPTVDKLLEIAVIVTDKDLNILAEGPSLVIHQPDEVRKKLYHVSMPPTFNKYQSTILDPQCNGRMVYRAPW